MSDLLATARDPRANQVSGFARFAADLSPEEITGAYHELRLRAPRRRAVGKAYFVGHTGFPGGDRGASNRSEEHLAIAMFNHHPERGGWPLPDGRSLMILDYQFPLKARRADAGVGKVDLVGVVDRTTVGLIELKHVDPGASGWGDTPLRAFLELLSYCAIVEANLGDITMEMTPAQLLRPVRGLEMLVVGSATYWQKWEDCSPAGCWQPPLATLVRAVSSAIGIPAGFLWLSDPAFEMGGPARRPHLTGRPALNNVEGLP